MNFMDLIVMPVRLNSYERSDCRERIDFSARAVSHKLMAI